MRHPQVLVIEFTRRLANLLRPLAEVEAWSLREVRHSEGCLFLLAQGGPAVVVLEVGRDLEQEFELMYLIQRQYPQTALVMVGDADHTRLAGLAWDLGAAYVHLAPEGRDVLLEIVAGFLNAKRKDGAS